MLLSTRTCCSCSIVALVSPSQPFLARMTWISVSRVVVFSDLIHFDLNHLESKREVELDRSRGQEHQRRRVIASGWRQARELYVLTYTHHETPRTSELSLATGSTWIIFPCWNWDPFDEFLQCTVQRTPLDSNNLGLFSLAKYRLWGYNLLL